MIKIKDKKNDSKIIKKLQVISVFEKAFFYKPLFNGFHTTMLDKIYIVIGSMVFRDQ